MYTLLAINFNDKLPKALECESLKEIFSSECLETQLFSDFAHYHEMRRIYKDVPSRMNEFNTYETMLKMKFVEIVKAQTNSKHFLQMLQDVNTTIFIFSEI
jgi:hypothetical protein